MSHDAPDRCALCAGQRRSPLCSSSDPRLERLLEQRTVHTYRRGQVVFHAGTPAQALYVIRSGRVRVFATWRNGTEQVLRLLGPGECFGYRPLLSGEVYNASAEAAEDASICIFPASGVLAALREVPDVSLEFLAKLARELRTSEELMMDLVHRPVRQRAARLLLGLLGEDGAPDERALTSRDVLRKDMARMIGTSPETFSRALRSLERSGAIALTREVIRVRNAARLRRIADHDAPGT